MGDMGAGAVVMNQKNKPAEVQKPVSAVETTKEKEIHHQV